MEGHPSNPHAGRDQINAPGGTVNNSGGPGIHLPGATIHGSVSINCSGPPHENPQVDEATTRSSEKKACLRSLGFSDIDARQHDIAPAYPGTCDWLFDTAQFRKWRDRADLPAHNGVLWIKGKPGAGKSTLMKHALRHCEEVFDDHLIVTYFFNARGEIFEKTPLGMLRSIVYQLLDKDDTLYERFLPIYEKQRVCKEGEWAWSRAQLEDFIRSVVNKRQSKPLLLLIDALDECDNRDVRDVVDFLEILSINAVQVGVTLRTCLSSRHYPNVSMRKTLELTVEASAEHEMDIVTYIKRRLEGHDNDIKAKVWRKAGGIFMWVVIVVSLLNRAYNDGRLEAMHKALEEVPANLEEVFNKLLSKNDPNKAETIRMLQWVLLSQRPLNPEELFFAELAGTAPEYSGPWNRSKITMTTIQRRITASSKGLIEARIGYPKSVQFIHLSVNDFLFRNKRLQTLDPTLEPDPISASHGKLWDRCRSFIQQLDIVLTSEQHIRQLSKDYPFLQYAASYMFDHAEKALSGETMQQEIARWLRMGNNWFGWWKIFFSTVNGHSYLERNMDAGLLYVLSLRGYRKLVTVILAGGSADVNAQGGNYGNALHAASANGHENVARLLLDAGADVNAQGGNYGNALYAASANGYENVARLLLNAGADAASVHGYKNVARLLLDAGADVNAQGGYYGNALYAASAGGHEDVTRLLLDAGANAESLTCIRVELN
ncbi:ankyrin repeat domain-containing protein [Gaeumannomyces tritici R3-111a-1]|uniref:Ankyrin repeat domain-containing protein n=1 Tax=Gaeumannomyces tritici (strain R3-111a-1) TaxID=644352 RepID=J3P9D2_GAET3|nr:ankyrin repeat domain-containing protein [Gaeumannomyces tritici R3-111a-1]EJT73268.1 ankyrin repeat domain-containing protein [Gaeumannomyces tritici R3-111a-1]